METGKYFIYNVNKNFKIWIRKLQNGFEVKDNEMEGCKLIFG